MLIVIEYIFVASFDAVETAPYLVAYFTLPIFVCHNSYRYESCLMFGIYYFRLSCKIIGHRPFLISDHLVLWY